MTTTTPTSQETRDAYLQQLQAALADLGATIRGHSTLGVQGLDVYVETNFQPDVISAVSFRTGYARREGRHHYTKTDVAHIAKAVRRVVEERSATEKARQAYRLQEEARDQREQLAAKRVLAAVERINDRSCAARYGRLVTKVEVSEHTKETSEHVYRWELDLQALSEAQALAILAIVEESRPWEPAPTAEQLLTPDCPDILEDGGIQCQLRVGHDGSHQAGGRRWS